MILVLTYHKVVEPGRGHGGKNFYSITSAALQAQLAILQARGYRALSVDDLRTEDVDSIKTGCLLTFDDGTADHYETVLPLLQQHRQRGVFFISTGKLDTPGYLTRDHVRKIAAAGHAIGCHAHHNRRLDIMSDEQIHEQIQESHQIISEIVGAPPLIFAPPGGYLDARVRAATFICGMHIIRTMRWGFNDQPDFGALQCIPLNRHVTPEQFEDILNRRRRVAMALLYQTKEAFKTVLPGRTYEGLRQFFDALVRKKTTSL